MKRTRRRLFLALETLEDRKLLHGGSLWSSGPGGSLGDQGGELSLEQAAEGESVQVADFQLEDVNPTSATFGQQVSPRNYLGQVSGWYFGHST